jgi:hypothetical protein
MYQLAPSNLRKKTAEAFGLSSLRLQNLLMSQCPFQTWLRLHLPEFFDSEIEVLQGLFLPFRVVIQ